MSKFKQIAVDVNSVL